MTFSTRVRTILTVAACVCLPTVAAGQGPIDFDSLACATPLAVTTQFGPDVPLFVSSWTPPNPYCVEVTLAGSSAPNLLIGDLEPNPPTGTGAAKASITWDYATVVGFTSVVGMDVGIDWLQLECFDATGGVGTSLGIDQITGCPPAPCGDPSGAGVNNFGTMTVTSPGIRSCTVSQPFSTEPFDGYAIDNIAWPVELTRFSIE